MIHAYVVDDERLAVERLVRLLEATGRVEVSGQTTDPDEALAFLEQNAVDVVFLDIQMPGMNGFELIERLGRDPLVVFATAYDRYALNAFAVNSVDYLLKPIEAERLDRALDKVERYLGARDLAPQPATMRTLARELAAQLNARAAHPALGRIASRVGERTTILDVARVSHFFARDKLAFAVSGGRDYVIDFTIAELESLLDVRRFVRIHRSTIVNVGFVHELYPGVDGLVARLKDERKTELGVARDRVRDLKERLGI